MRPRTRGIARRAQCGCCRRCVTRKRQCALGGPLRRLRSSAIAPVGGCGVPSGSAVIGGHRNTTRYRFASIVYPPSFRCGGGGRRAALSTAVVGGCLEGQVDRRDCEDGSDPCPTAPGTAPGRQAFLAKKLGSGHRDPAAGAAEPQTATMSSRRVAGGKSRCELYLSRTPFNQRVSG